jgi:TldD protein
VNPAPAAADVLIRAQGVSKRFGITQALDQVTVEFRRGEVHALMGENGAGKSTLGKTIAGLHRQDAGTVTVAGHVLTPGDIDEAFAKGIRLVHQELAQCPNLQEATSRLLEGTDHLNRLGQHLQVRRGSYARNWQDVLVVASDGTHAHDIRLHQSLGLNVLAADGDHRASLGRRYGSHGRPDELRQWQAEESARDLCDSAATMLRADYVEAGQFPVVLANRFGGVIFHEACGHLLETTQIERGTTPFAEELGQEIAHPAVTAIDEGLTDGAFGSLAMDDEGMAPQRTVLIENGILRRFLSDRAGEIRTGHGRTGSGRRQSHAYAAASRMRNTYIAAGPHTPDALIASIDKGLYCKSMGGGSVGPTGQFNFAVEEGFLIENGQLTRPVKGATLIGEAKEVMPRISMCANDLELAAGFCGSVSGSIFVTVGQPHIKVDTITVGGR